MGREPSREKGTGPTPEPLGPRPSGIRSPWVSGGQAGGVGGSTLHLAEEPSQGDILEWGDTMESPKQKGVGRGGTLLDKPANG